MQRNIALGRRPQHDKTSERSRAPGGTSPGATAVLNLAKYRLASRWHSLLWFWIAFLSIAAMGGLVLELLGPPAERAFEVPGPRTAASPAETRPPLAAATALTVLAPPAAVAATGSPATARLEPSSPSQPSPGLDAQAPGNTAQQDPQPRGRVLIVLHPARSEGSAAVASRLAARAGLDSDQIDVGPNAEAKSAAVIRFYSAGDHALARRLGQELARMGYTWKIENFAARSWAWKDQAIEVFLPDR